MRDMGRKKNLTSVAFNREGKAGNEDFLEGRRSKMIKINTKEEE